MSAHAQGFVDLRVDALHRMDEDSVWPSFTDIMTVVVMIFLMVLIAILIRNVELVKELRATMEAERAAAEIAQATAEQKANLAVRLVALEEQLSQLRLLLLQEQEQHETTKLNLVARATELRRIENERDLVRRQREALQREKQALVAERAELQGELSQAQKTTSKLVSNKAKLETKLAGVSDELAGARQTNLALTSERSALEQRVTALTDNLAETEESKQALTAQKSTLEQRLMALADDLQALRQLFTVKESELETVQRSRQSEQRVFVELKGEYADLKQKYDRLVRPARTALGKHIVDIRYSKQNGQFLIQLREPGETAYREMSRSALHDRLRDLKDQFGKKLYTKIVIPEQSGLSYSEAWSFTNDLLYRYDYYYR